MLCVLRVCRCLGTGLTHTHAWRQRIQSQQAYRMWFNHRSRHCLPVRPGMNPAILVHIRSVPVDQVDSDTCEHGRIGVAAIT